MNAFQAHHRLHCYLHAMWAMSYVCRLLANNPGPLAFNSGRRGRILSNNSGRKCGCLQVLRFMFAGRYKYVFPNVLIAP